jgi:hypothetical protein
VPRCSEAPPQSHQDVNTRSKPASESPMAANSLAALESAFPRAWGDPFHTRREAPFIGQAAKSKQCQFFAVNGFVI